MHVHPPYATAWAVAGRVPPLVHTAARGRPRADRARRPRAVGLAASSRSSSPTRSRTAELRVALLREHGTVAVGPDLRTAYYCAEYLEDTAKVALLAAQVEARRRRTASFRSVGERVAAGDEAAHRHPRHARHEGRRGRPRSWRRIADARLGRPPSIDVGLDDAPAAAGRRRRPADSAVAGAAGASLRRCAPAGDAATRADGRDGPRRRRGCSQRATRPGGSRRRRRGRQPGHGDRRDRRCGRCRSALPKVIVSTVASGDVGRYVGDTDIAMFFSVGDLLGGPNPVTAPHARPGRRRRGRDGRGRATATPPSAPAVGLTAFGNTHRAAVRVMERPARGRPRRRAVPRLGRLRLGDGAPDRRRARSTRSLDLTTHELLGELYPEDAYAPVRPGRLTAAGRAAASRRWSCPAASSTSASARPRRSRRGCASARPTTTTLTTPTCARAATSCARVGALMAERLNASRRARRGARARRAAGRRSARPAGATARPRGQPGARRRAARAACGPSIEVRELDARHQRSESSPTRSVERSSQPPGRPRRDAGLEGGDHGNGQSPSTTHAAPIPATMRAAVLFGPGDIRTIERPVPEPGRGEVLVRGRDVRHLRHRPEDLRRPLPA